MAQYYVENFVGCHQDLSYRLRSDDRTVGEGYGGKSQGQVFEESHCGIGKEYVPMNLSNKDGQPSAG